MRVLGTAGHVDHGKSTLVRKLTGIDPDRLAEEKARQMTIDLGFAWLTLPNGETLGIIDVPGHRDFIENMLAGVGGIDAALLVIAADEGVMPQTREHLAILDLLGIEHGLIALTKIDLVDDEGWLDLIEQDIRDITSTTALARAPLVRLSAHTGAGIPELLNCLVTLLDAMPPRVDYQHPRLPIDRVFTISGFGTVVTGTLLGGALRIGDEVEVQPGGLRGRVRGLQSYKQPVERAEPGSRTAVNISGIDRKLLARGQVLSHPGLMQASEWVDVRFRHLADAGRPLRHDAQVKFFVGAAESLAQVRLLDAEALLPGHEGWLQLRLRQPVALAQGDRFILRSPSPAQTIGGGVVVNPHPERRWKRFQPAVIAELETRMRGTPAQRVAQAASQREPLRRAALQKHLGCSDSELDAAIQSALEQGLLVELEQGAYMAAETVSSLLHQMIGELRLFHEAEPLRLGMSREELRTRVGLRSATFALLLAAQDQIVEEQNRVRLAGHRVVFTDEQQARIAELEARFAAAPYTPPSFAEAAQIVGEPLLYALIDLGRIVQVQPDVILSAPVYQEMVETVLCIIDQDGQIAANTLRDRFSTTRKYAIGLLEYLDSIHVTRRVGDFRVRGSRQV